MAGKTAGSGKATKVIVERDGSSRTVELLPGIDVELADQEAGRGSITVWHLKAHPVHADSIYLYERPTTANVYGQVGASRITMGTPSRAEAVKKAMKLLQERYAKAALGEAPTAEPKKLRVLGMVRLIREKKLHHRSVRSSIRKVSAKEIRAREKVLDIALTVLDPSKAVSAIDQSDSDTWRQMRTEGNATDLTFRGCTRASVRTAPGLRLGPGCRTKQLPLCDEATVANDLGTFRTLIQLVIRYGEFPESQRMESNPMAGLVDQKVSEAKDAHHIERFTFWQRCMDEVEAAAVKGGVIQTRRGDPATEGPWPHLVQGFFKAFMCLLFGHGHRNGSVERLEIEDVAFTHSGIVKLIEEVKGPRDAERPAPAWAKHWPFGAVRYHQTKNKYDRVVPLSQPQAQILQEYLAARQSMLDREGLTSNALFPDPRGLAHQTQERLEKAPGDVFRMLAHHCDDLARALAAAEQPKRKARRGRPTPPPAEVVFGGNGEIIYGFRHTVKTAREALGWVANKNVFYLCDWTVKSRVTAQDNYSKLNPQALQAIVDGLSFLDYLKLQKESGDQARISEILRMAGPATVASPTKRRPRKGGGR